MFISAGPIDQGPVTASALTSSGAETVGERRLVLGQLVVDDESPVVYLIVPRSDAYPRHDLMHYQHGSFGGTLAGSYFELQVGARQVVVTPNHRGHGGDPRLLVPEIATAELVTVDLGTGPNTVTSADVADLFITALAGAGIGARAWGVSERGRTILEIDADDLTIPPAVDTTDRSYAHVVGVLRDMWAGPTVDENADGDPGSTVLYTHLGEPEAYGTGYRVKAVHYWQTGGLNGTLGIASGSNDYSAPGVLDMRGEVEVTDAPSVVPSGRDSNFTAAPLPEMAVMANGEALWVMNSNTATAGARPRFRSGTAVPRGWGTVDIAEESVFEVGVAPSTFGDEYTPGTIFNAPSPIAMVMGAFVEYPQGGRYHFDGSIRWRIGEQSDALHGSPFYATVANLEFEATLHRIEWGDWTDIDLELVARWIGDLGAGEDCRVMWVGWNDLGNPQAGTPSADAPTVLYDLGPMGMTTANGWNYLELDPPVPLGRDALSHTYMGLGFNYAAEPTTPGDTAEPGTAPALATMTLPVLLNLAYDDRWEDYGHFDSPYIHHDDLAPHNNRAPPVGRNEYQLVSVPGIPVQNVEAPYPATLHPPGSIPGGTLGSPPAVAWDYIIVSSPGYVRHYP